MNNNSLHTKEARLSGMRSLRVANYLGMIHWDFMRHSGDAYPKVRLIHPITWIMLGFLLLTSCLMQGVPETVKDLKNTLKDDAVWF